MRIPARVARHRWGVVTGLFLTSSAVRFAASLPIVWCHISDEAFYGASAKSFVSTLKLTIGGRFNAFSMPLYSIFISPAFVFANMDHAFIAAKLMNCLAMSSTIFPVYLLARSFTEHSAAIGVAALSVLIGPMFYTFTMMSESLHYPLALWVVYLTFLALMTGHRRVNVALGLLLGLAILNKMSSTALLVAFVLALAVDPNAERRPGSIAGYARRYVLRLWMHKSVFSALLLTVTPYAILRTLLAGPGEELLPYSNQLSSYGRHLATLDLVRLAKWSLIYVGELNVSTGLFLLPFAILAAISLCRSERPPERALGVVSSATSVVVLGLAILQSGYRFLRLTDRHFFILTPLVLLLAFMWLSRSDWRMPWKGQAGVFLLVSIASGFALFAPSRTYVPACDSAFVDAVTLSAGWHQYQVRLSILAASILLAVLACGLKETAPGRGIAVVAVLVAAFMLAISFATYSRATILERKARNTRGALADWLGASVSRNANLVFLLVPRQVVLDYILWRGDASSDVSLNARRKALHGGEVLQSGEVQELGLRISDLTKLERTLMPGRATYFISPAFGFCGMAPIATGYGLSIFETRQPATADICRFRLDFGTSPARGMLRDGWSFDEGPYPEMGHPTLTWATAAEASVEAYVADAGERARLRFRAMPRSPGTVLDVLINGRSIGAVTTSRGWREYGLPIGANRLRRGKNVISFRFGNFRRPAQTNTRRLVVAFDWLVLKRARPIRKR